MSAPLLEVQRLTFRYGKGSAKPTLDSLSFAVAPGEIVAVIGPNGSGKSTLLKLVSGVMRSSDADYEGFVRFEGRDVSSFAPAQRARSIAYVPAELHSDFPMTAYEVVLMGRYCHLSGLGSIVRSEDAAAIEMAMRDCDCWELRDRELSTLSGGEAQLVALARAIAQGSRVLLLDEAFSRMDLNHQVLGGKILRTLAGSGRAILWVAHDLNLLTEWAERAILIREGKLLLDADTPLDTALTEEQLLALYPGASLKVSPSPYTGKPKVWFT